MFAYALGSSRLDHEHWDVGFIATLVLLEQLDVGALDRLIGSDMRLGNLDITNAFDDNEYLVRLIAAEATKFACATASTDLR